METLSTELRRQLERTVVEARDVAEAGARRALEALAVHHHEPYDHMSGGQRKLRNRLRAHARHLGDRVDARSGAHEIDHLVHECACEHWHGMLFARFLAENQLLIEPEMGVAITLNECEELAKEEGVDQWALAARFAHRMLPQVFRPEHPVFEVQLAREYRLKLEDLVEGLPAEMFTATDALGWVYQFWQTRKKDEVNRSEVKIGADELPAVTQLFTEPYMVQFLLHNSLGAWWVSRHSDKACPVDLTYLRRTEDGTPAAGAFEGWPDDLSEFRLLDPCCGSGHFLIAALLILVPMRVTLEGLSPAAAVDAVLRENLHGLELDQRCVAIAAFALALEAWRYPGADGYRTLPKLNLAWCGQPVAGNKAQWIALAEGDSRLEAGMTALYDTFRDAPTLGSLIDPARSIPEDMLTAGFDELQLLLDTALRDYAGEENWEETAIAAQALSETAKFLYQQYNLVITNVPYLARGKQNNQLRKFSEARFPSAKNDLANVFLERCLELALARGRGFVQIVMPQNWLAQPRYKNQRRELLQSTTWCLLAQLGPAAFQIMDWWAFNVCLLTLKCERPVVNHRVVGLDVATPRSPTEKARLLVSSEVSQVAQQDIRSRADLRLVFHATFDCDDLATYANSRTGTRTADNPQFLHCFWEHTQPSDAWVYEQTTPDVTSEFSGRNYVLLWEHGAGKLEEYRRVGLASIQGRDAWGKSGVCLSLMRNLPATLYSGHIFDMNSGVVWPKMDSDLPALWAFLSSPEYAREVRKLDRQLKLTTGTLLQVPFSHARWERVARERYPKGLPSPSSDDLSQWIFHGHPAGSNYPLHVAVARLAGYRWPPESDTDIQLADEMRLWTKKGTALHRYEDNDGVVCVPSVRGEQPASERLLQLLHAAYGDDWDDSLLTKLLAESGSTSLDNWLRNQFFVEHCKLFHHRPFIWHVWDGRKRDGFHALVNCHKLAEGDGKGRRLLESLTYSYVGDWISRQQDGVKRGAGGAEDRLVAALELKKRLVAILEGEPPFDLFVRWKPVEEQAIGWEPDINDGVRLNIRPFMAQDLPGGKKGAGILRAKPNIHWKKDRGKEPARDEGQYPWFWVNGEFTGERVNDVHLGIADKRAARAERGAATDA